MTTFIELVVAPAMLPWVIVFITDYVEAWLDQKEETRVRRDVKRSAMRGHSV